MQFFLSSDLNRQLQEDDDKHDCTIPLVLLHICTFHVICLMTTKLSNWNCFLQIHNHPSNIHFTILRGWPWPDRSWVQGRWNRGHGRVTRWNSTGTWNYCLCGPAVRWASFVQFCIFSPVISFVFFPLLSLVITFCLCFLIYASVSFSLSLALFFVPSLFHSPLSLLLSVSFSFSLSVFLNR